MNDLTSIQLGHSLAEFPSLRTSTVSLKNVAYLIQKGAAINQFGNDGLTALMNINFRKRKDIGDLLIQSGADVNYSTGVLGLLRLMPPFTHRMLK